MGDRELDRDLDGNISKQEFIEGSKSKLFRYLSGARIPVPGTFFI